MGQNVKFSLVDVGVIRRDPRKLSFLAPKLPLSRFRALTDEYYRACAIKAAEEVANIAGQLLVPSGCMSKKRRDPARRLMIFGRTYYVLSLDEMTPIEIQKYRQAVAAEGGSEASNELTDEEADAHMCP